MVMGMGGAWAGGALGAAFGMGTLGAAVGFSVGSLIGSYMFPMNTSVKSPSVGNYPIQTGTKGGCVTVVYGTRRVAGNIIWFGEIRQRSKRIA